MEWSRPHAAESALALALGLLGALLLARRAARSPGARSWALLGLRAASLAVVVLILLDPVRVAETRIPVERPSAVFLFDGSRSMGLERPSTRLDQVTRQVSQAESSISPDRLPKIERYRFGRELAAIPAGEAPTALEDESRLLGALERLPGRFGETPPTGVFVFSDGRTTETSGFEALARGFKKLGVPIHVLPAGDASVAGDVSIRDLIVPREVPKGSKVPVKVLVGSRGFEGQRAEVVVRPATGTDLRPLASLPLTLRDGEQPAEVVIEADRARGELIAEVVPLAGEAVPDNNAVPFRIAAKDRKVRVIYMEGSPEPEYAFIRDALVEDPRFECVALAVDFQSNVRPRLHRVDDPSKGYPTTREELFSFDVVICSDISRAAFTPAQLEWTVELVARRGGGFAMIGGNTSFGSGGWDRTTWDGMIPIDMSGDGPGMASPYYNGEFRVVVPPSAESHPIWRIVDDPARNRQILDRMPRFFGTNLTDRLKPAGVLLGLSDRPISGNGQFAQNAQGASSRRRAGARAGGSPIFSAQPYGKGRSFAMSTDSTVSWGYEFEHYWGEGDNRYFRKFWRNVAAWLAENSSAADGRLEISTDKALYRPGQPVLVTARAFDDRRDPTDRYRLVARLSGIGPDRADDKPGNPAPASPMAYRPPTRDFGASLPVPAADRSRAAGGPPFRSATVEVTAFDGERAVGNAKMEVQVLDDSEEFRDPRPDRARLVSLARESGGSVIGGPADLARLLETEAGGGERVVTTRSPAWDNSALLTLLFALLTVEWTTRRWMGMA